MAIGLQTNNSAINVNRNLSIIKKDEDKSAKKIASGYSINSASDDASGLSISEKLKAQIAATYAASSNAQSGISAVQVADGAMDQMQGILNRVTELTTQAGGIRGYGEGGQAIQAEIDALTSEIDRISSSTSFNGINLLDGSLDASSVDGEALTLQVGASSGSYDSVSISVSSMSAESLGLGSIDVTTDPAAALDAVTSAINTISSARAELGATSNRLEYTVSNLANSGENLTSANSLISETDISKEVIELSLKKAQEKAAQLKLAQANQHPAVVASLLFK